MQFLEQPAHPKGPAYELSEFLDQYRQKEQSPPIETQAKPSGGPVTRKVRELMSSFVSKADPIPDAWDVEPAPKPVIIPEPTPEPPKMVAPEVIVHIPESKVNEDLTEKVSTLTDLVTKLAARDTPKTQGRRKLIVRRDTEGRISSIEEDD
jgi:hypothetical protein